MEIQDYTQNGQCPENCGKCCTSVLPLNLHEINKLKRYINKNSIYPSHSDVGKCPFLNENGRCKVYVHRPEICHAFGCNKHIEHFNHSDKNIIDFWSTFYPERLDKEELKVRTEEVYKLDVKYQCKKIAAYNKTCKKNSQ